MGIENILGTNENTYGSTFENSKSHRQVFYLTHLANGESDSFMNRSFISFSYGGKNIEDFNLIACIDGNKMEKHLTGNFNNLVSNYDVINGQYYWGSYFSSNELSLTLATDGITQQELENFIHWFAPGEIKELILAEHPNRAIMARIDSSPILSTIPFEEKVQFNLDDRVVETSTTLYKGEIKLKFIMDDPFWYSKINLLVRENEQGQWVKEWREAHGNNVEVINNEIINNKDALKIIYEDGIPTLPVIDDLFFNNKIFLGNGLFFQRVDDMAVVGYAIVGSAIVSHNYYQVETDLTLNTNEVAYLYYTGTAPETPKISFDFKPILNDNLIKLSILDNEYSYISFISTKEQKLLLGLPSAFYGYNQIIKIFEDMTIDTFGKMREKIRSDVHHFYAKQWASCVLNYAEKFYNNLEQNTRNTMITLMEKFLLNKNIEPAILSTNYCFDAENNKYIGKLGYRIAVGELPATLAEWDDYGEFNNKEEDISEVIRSKYIILSEKNHLNEKYNVQPWNEDDPTLSYKIINNFNVPLENFIIEYKNKYY